MALASPLCLMARATHTKSWLWHQRLSHLNFDTINDLAKNDLVSGLPKFKYAKEHLCPSCEQGKCKRASHPPKSVLNSKQRLHLLHMDLCGPMRVPSINEDESETNDQNDPQGVPSFVQSSKQVKTLRHSVQPVKVPVPDATLKPTSPKSNYSSKRRNRKTFFVCRSVEHLIKDCNYHAMKKAQPTPRNYAHEEENIKLLNEEVQARDTALVTLRQKLNQAEHESGGYHVVPLSITGTFMLLKPDLVFHTAPIVVETNHSAFTGVPSFVQSSKQVKTLRHSVQPVKVPVPDATLKPTSPKSNYSSKRRNRKTFFVCRSVEHLIKDCNYHAMKKAQPTPRNYAHEGNNKKHALFTHKHPQKHMVPAIMLTQSKPVSITAVRPVCASVPKIMVTRPRHAHLIDTKSKSPIRRHITHSSSPKTSNSPPRVTAAQALVVSAAKGKKGKR
nr:retrovirus-related Pol polyprotein from transposon TNT 1-94 [Tanacetum cinerariifolium]